MARSTATVLLLALSLGCAMGEMSQGAPADSGLDEAEDDGTPLTTGADDGGDAGAPGDAGEPAEDDGAGADEGEPASDDAAADDAAAEDDGEPQTDDDAGDAGESTGGADTADGGDDAGASTGDDDGGEPLPSPIDASGWEIVQTDAYRVVTLPAGTIVPPGAYLVIGRDATRAQFEAFWGPLPADTVYIDGATLDPEAFPTINGGESYEVIDDSGAGVDGPSAPLALLANQQRVDPGEPAGLAASWTSSVDANGDATPGAGQVDSALFSGLYVSEVSDVSGSGNFVYEFVELYHDP